jgi:DNA-3-methyladenine glycosylase II
MRSVVCRPPSATVFVTHSLLDDPIMSGLVKTHGPVDLRPLPAFETLLRSIVSQQISTRAAETITGRLEERMELTPSAIARAHARGLQAAGLSRAKARYVRELARFTLDGGLEDLDALDDHGVVERLTSVCGIGVWTAEMFLIFALNRPDVWPIGDGGIQRAARTLYRVRAARSLTRLGERFRPWRSHAAWYLWRSLETE